MRSYWEGLRLGLLRSIEARDSIAAFDELKSRGRVFDGFETPADLVTSVSPAIDLDARDPVLWAMVRATRDPRLRRLAQTLLLLCFWPALDAMFRRRFGLFPNRPQDLASEIVGRFTIELQRVDVGRVGHLTATLLRNTERDVIRTRRRERLVASRTTEVKPESAVVAPPEPEPPRPPLGSLADLTDPESIPALSAWLRRAIGDDADLVLDAIVRRKRRAQIAVSLGISHAAARKRLERALARARASLFANPQSQPAASVALAC
ncbi:MAG TPA: hypothetical protein VHO06_15815 [Polyangia bacterium]|nr:hypothetical protein [Polyangia bacterium]